MWLSDTIDLILPTVPGHMTSYPALSSPDSTDMMSICPSLQLALEPRLLLSADLVALAASTLADTPDSTAEEAVMVFAGHTVDTNGEPVGRELLVTDGDGTAPRLLKDIYPGARSSAPTDFYKLKDGRVLFVANDGVHGRELWWTDGTAKGTQRLGDINTGSDLAALHVGIVNGQDGDRLRYTPAEGGRIQSRWDATGQVLTLYGGGSVAEYMAALGEVTFQRGSGSDHGLSDGETLSLVVAAGPDLPVHFDAQQRPRFLDIVGKQRISATRARDEVFWSDRYGLDARLAPVLTAHELELAKELMHGRGIDNAWIGLEQVGNQWLLDWNGDRQGRYAANTLLAGIAQGGDLSDENGPYGVLRKAGGNSYEIYGDVEHAGSKALYSSTFRNSPYGYLVEYTPKPGEAYGTLLEFTVDSQSRITFTEQVLTMGAAAPGTKSTSSAAQLGSDSRLQVSSGGEDKLLLRPADRQPFRGTGDSLATRFIEFTDSDGKDWVLFAANDGVHGVELWRLDPATGELTLLKDINTDKSQSWNSLGSAYPEGFVVFGDQVLFAALDGTHGRELWITDGTSDGTQRLKDIRTGNRSLKGSSLPRDSEPLGLTVFESTAGTRAVFAAAGNSGGQQLWLTDGTGGGTQLLKTIRSGGDAGLDSFVVVKGTTADKVFFVAYDGRTSGRELWVTDGTAVGTQVIDVLPGRGSSRPAHLTAYGQHVFFTATGPGTQGRELWVSDGTTAGTVQVANIDTRTASGSRRLNQGPRDLFVFGDTLLFAAEDNSKGYEPYALDLSPLKNGTVAQFAGSARPVALGNLRADAGKGSFPRLFTRLGEKVLFTADDGVVGRELWETDGTKTNTRRVADSNPGLAGSSPTGLQVATATTVKPAADDTLVVVGAETAIVAVSDGLKQARSLLLRLRPMKSPKTGMELFITGNDGQVSLLKDIRLGRDGSYPGSLVPLVNGHVLFVADDGWRGRELWLTDGTPGGTRLWKDVYPGAPSSDPYLLQVLGDEVYFVADDGTHGFELWQIDKTSGRAVRLTDKTLGPAHTAIQALALHQGEVVFQEDDDWYGFDSQGVPKELTATPTIDARNNAPIGLASYALSTDMTQYFRTLQIVSSVSTGKVYDLSRARIVIEAADNDDFSRWSLRALARTLSEDLQDKFGVVVPVEYTASKRPGDLVLVVDTDTLSSRSQGGDEKYRLDIGAQWVEVKGVSPRAVFHGTRTLLKLMNLAGGVAVDGQVTLPEVVIKDWPGASWRGMMLDVGRKYMQPDFLEQQLRQASWSGLNVLRMHVSEWNAIRLDSQQFPGLGEARSIPANRRYGPYADSNDPRFYSRTEIERLQDVARRYFIDLVFEIDMPGHLTIASEYDPHLLMDDVRGHTWQPHQIDITTPYGRRWAANLLDEFMPHFDSAYYHIGGDEVYDGRGTNALSRYAVVLGFGSNDKFDVSTHWINATAARLSSEYGKRIIFWNGIEHKSTGSLDREIIIQSWEGKPDPGYELIFSQDRYPRFTLYYTPARPTGPFINEASLYRLRLPEYNNVERVIGYEMPQWSDFGEDISDGWFQNGIYGGPRADQIGKTEGLKMAVPAVAAAFWNPAADKRVQGGWPRYQALLDALGRAPGLFSLDVSTDDEDRLLGARTGALYYDTDTHAPMLLNPEQTLAYVGGTRAQLSDYKVTVSISEVKAGDRLGLAPSSGFQVKGGKVWYFGREVGKVRSGKDGVGATLELSLNYRANHAVLDALLRSLTYSHVVNGDDGAPLLDQARDLTVVVSGRTRDYRGQLRQPSSLRYSRSVEEMPSYSIVVAAGETHAFQGMDFGDSRIRVMSLPAQGSLLLNGKAVLTDTVVASTDLSKLHYQPNKGSSGSDSFAFRVWDGTAWSGQRTMVLTVNARATGKVQIDTDDSAAEGETLRGVVTEVVDTDGLTGVSYSYQWQRGTTDDQDKTIWTDISDATGLSYTLVQADVGHTVRLVVSFEDDMENPELLISAPSVAVQPLRLVVTGDAVRSVAERITIVPEVVLRFVDAAAQAVSTYPAVHVILVDGKQSGDTLDVASQVLTANGVTKAWDSTRGVLTLTGGATVAAYQSVLREIQLVGTVPGKRQVVITVGPSATMQPFWFTDSDGVLRVRYYEIFSENGSETLAAMVQRAKGLPAKFGMQPYLATIASAAEADFIAGLVRRALADSQLNRANYPAMLFGLHKDGSKWVYEDGPEVGLSDTDLGLAGKRKTADDWTSSGSGVRGALEITGPSSYWWYPAPSSDTWSNGFVVEYGHEALEAAVLQALIAVEKVANSMATGAVTITGTVAQGQALQADTSSIQDADGLTGVIYSYQWQRETTDQGTTTWADISGATASSYTLVQADVDQQVRVVVSFTDDAGNPETKVKVVNNMATGAVTITGTPEQGQTLTADTNSIQDVNGLTGVVYRYQWQRSTGSGATWTDIASATGASYTLVQADVGQKVRVVVSFEDNAGNTETLTSAASVAVTDVNDAATGSVTITGTVTQGQTLSAAGLSSVADADGTPLGGFAYRYQWQRGTTDDQGETTWTNIASATASSYRLVQADVGQKVRVVVRFDDAEGNTETLTSTAEEAVMVFAGHTVDTNGEPVGRELLVTDGDGTAPRLLKDIYPGARSSAPTDFYKLKDGRVLFVANDGVHGRELWWTDGTAKGTQRLGDINTGSDLAALHVGIVNGQDGDRLRYTPAEGGRIQSRWDATGQVLTLYGGGSVAEYMAALGEVTFQRGSGSDHGLSDGETLSLVVAAGPDLPVHFDAQQRPRFLDIVGKQRISATRARDEVFWSDRYGLDARLAPVLTAHELELAKELMHGRGIDNAWIGLEQVGNQWLLDWNGDRQGRYAANTLLAGIAQGGDLSDENGPYGVLRKAGGNSYEIYGDVEHAGSKALYSSTFRNSPYGYLVEYTPKPGEAYGTLLEFTVDSQSRITFTEQVLTMGAAAPGTKSTSSAAQLGSDSRLQVSSGGEDKLLLRPADRQPFRGTGDSLATRFIEFTDSDGKDWVLFAANDGVHGVELWRLDPATGELTLLKDINTDKSQSWNSLGSAYPEGFVVFGDQVLFAALDGTHGRELWITDGTSDGTQRLKDIRTGNRSLKGSSLPRDSEPLGLTVFESTAGTRAVFAAAGNSGGQQLWLTDGTGGGTQLLKTIRSGGDAGLDSFVVVKGTTADKVFFVAYDGRTSGRELWVTDGTAVGTQVIDVLPGRGSSRPAHLTAYGQHVFFTATGPGTQGRELWVSDGTTAGTVQVANIDTRTASGSRRLNQGPRDLFVFGDTLLFAAEDNSKGYEPYALDLSPLKNGTVAQFAGSARPVALGNLRADAGKGSFPRLFTRLGEKVLFTADDGVVGRELWETDGTKTNTRRVADSNPGLAGSSPTGLQVATATTVKPAADDTLVVVGAETAIVAVSDGLKQARSLLLRLRPMKSPKTGMELFITGNDGQVSLLKDIRLGRDGSYPGSLVPLVNGHVLFVADDGWRGRELWLTDGTPGGTRLWKDVYPGAPSSDPYLLQVLGDEVYFVADDGTHGFELWQIDKTSGRAVRLTDKTLGPAHTAIQALALHQGEVVFQEDDDWYGFDSQGVPKELTATPTIDARNNAPIGLASYALSTDMTQYFRTLQIVSSVSTGKVYDLSRARIVIEAADNDDFSRWSLRALARTLSEDLQDKFGVVVPVEYTASKRPGDLVLVVDTDTLSSRSQGGDEKYRLDIGAQWVEVKGVSPRAVFHGTRTLLKLMNLAGGVAVDGQVTLPEVVIKDWPGASWRGMMLDVGRKYMQPDFLEQQLRQASWSGLNVLRMHVSEWNAIRLDSQQFPGLGEARSIPANRRYGPYADSNDPRFYSRTEIERLQDVARRYFIDLVFEIDMPGHLTIASEYDPHLLMDDVRGHTWQPHQIDITTPYGRRWAANLLDEFMPHFDSAYYHIGGDEVYDGRGTNALSRYAVVLGFGSNDKFDVSTHWINATAARLSSEYGKRIIFWNGIEHKSTGSLDREIIIQSWEGKPDPGYELIFSQDRYPRFTLYYTPARPTGPFINEASLYRLRLPEYNNVERVIGYEMPQWSDFGEDISDGWFQNGIYGGPRADQIGKTEGLKMAVPAVAAAFWNPAADKRVQGGWPRYQALLDALGRAPGLFSLDVSTDDEDRLLGARTGALYYDTDTHAPMLLNPEQTLAYVGGTRAQLSDYKVTVSISEVKAGDRLGLAPSSGFQVKGGKVWYFGREVGKVRSGKDGVGATLELSLNYRANHAVLDALLRSLTYSHVVNGDDGAPLLDQARDLTVVVSGRTRDYRGQLRQPSSLRYSRSVEEMPSYSIVVAAGETHAFQGMDFGDSRIRVMSLPAQGSLLLNGKAVLTDTVVASTDLSKLHYQPNKGSSGSDSFAFRVWDGTAWSGQRTMVLTVNARATGKVQIDTDDSAAEGETLRGVVTEVVDTDGLTGVSYSYQWQRGTTDDQDKTIWTDISDATGLSYTLVQADVGHTVRLVVSFEDDGGNTETLTSTASGTVANVNDEPTGAVVVTGGLTGQLQAEVSGIADADGLTEVVYSYQWQRGTTDQGETTWTDISDATASSYTLVRADVGQQVRVVVSFEDDGGNTETLTSAATAALVARPSLTVVNGGSVQQGAMLLAGTGTLGRGRGDGESHCLAMATQYG